MSLARALICSAVLLTVAGPVLAEGLVCHRVLGALPVGDQGVGAVQGQAPVVADDAAAAIGIGQTGDDVVGAGGADPRGVDVGGRVVVGPAVAGGDQMSAVLI